jgi:hypothetical protein
MIALILGSLTTLAGATGLGWGLKKRAHRKADELAQAGAEQERAASAAKSRAIRTGPVPSAVRDGPETLAQRVKRTTASPPLLLARPADTVERAPEWSEDFDWTQPPSSIRADEPFPFE